MRVLLSVILYVLLFASCKNGAVDKNQVSLKNVSFAPPPPVVKADEAVGDLQNGNLSEERSVVNNKVHTANPMPAVSKKIIKEGEISIEISNIQNTRKSLVNQLNQLQGYVEEESEDQGEAEQRKEYKIKIRIPAQNFDKYLNGVVAEADHIEFKNIRIQDVTTQFIDITTRLNNKKLLEDRYKALLQKATKMADILEVESKLTDIRTEIEAAQGQLNYLNKQITYSSLTITFFTKSEFGNNSNSFGYKLKNAFSDSGELLQSLFFGIITLWPVLLLAVIVIFLLRKWFKRRIKTVS